VAVVVGFPLGCCTTEAKRLEARELVALGVDELDMVLNVGKLKDGKFDNVLDDIKQVVAEARRTSTSTSTSSSGSGSSSSTKHVLVKVIIESGSLTANEIVDACLLSAFAGADFVKTSTGFIASAGGAKVDDVALMKSVVGDKLEVKASGGVRSFADAKAMVEAGATRIGASAGVAIVTEALKASSGATTTTTTSTASASTQQGQAY
jgi:deoxyribose-phosphate aldolase